MRLMGMLALAAISAVVYSLADATSGPRSLAAAGSCSAPATTSSLTNRPNEGEALTYLRRGRTCVAHGDLLTACLNWRRAMLIAERETTQLILTSVMLILTSVMRRVCLGRTVL